MKKKSLNQRLFKIFNIKNNCGGRGGRGGCYIKNRVLPCGKSNDIKAIA